MLCDVVLWHLRERIVGFPRRERSGVCHAPSNAEMHTSRPDVDQRASELHKISREEQFALYSLLQFNVLSSSSVFHDTTTCRFVSWTLIRDILVSHWQAAANTPTCPVLPTNNLACWWVRNCANGQSLNSVLVGSAFALPKPDASTPRKEEE